MALGQAVMIVAGLGCRTGASTSQIEAAIKEAVCSAGLEIRHLHCLATAERKTRERGLWTTACRLGLRLVPLSDEALIMATHRTRTHSPRVIMLFGVPSLAEAAALACAGPTSQLLAPRTAIGAATCALARFVEAEP